MKRYLIFSILLLALLAAGCAKKPVEPAEPDPPEPEAVQPEPEPEVPEPKEEKEPEPLDERALYQELYEALPTSHTVERGECLWWIAEYTEIYNDPFMWPLIYKDNRDKIDNPDLIYPDQVFSIPRDFQKNELTESRREAGAPRPYLPDESARLPADLRENLGWSF